MRRAKVRPVHVVRCIIYGSNAAVWTGLLITACSPLHGVASTVQFAQRIAIFSAVLAAMNLYHLGTAFGRYLHFDHPWATIAASQIIVVMIFWIVAINLEQITH